jgi:hypothetical protein
VPQIKTLSTQLIVRQSTSNNIQNWLKESCFWN